MTNTLIFIGLLMYGYNVYLNFKCDRINEIAEKRSIEYHEYWKKTNKLNIEEQKVRIKEKKINNTLLSGKKAFIFNEKDYLDYVAKYVMDKQKKRK